MEINDLLLGQTTTKLWSTHQTFKEKFIFPAEPLTHESSENVLKVLYEVTNNLQKASKSQNHIVLFLKHRLRVLNSSLRFHLLRFYLLASVSSPYRAFNFYISEYPKISMSSPDFSLQFQFQIQIAY